MLPYLDVRFAYFLAKASIFQAYSQEPRALSDRNFAIIFEDSEQIVDASVSKSSKNWEFPAGIFQHSVRNWAVGEFNVPLFTQTLSYVQYFHF